jgi:hypothetical protein
MEPVSQRQQRRQFIRVVDHALNADTGATSGTTGDARRRWDYDAVQDLILADLSIDGTKRQVSCRPTKWVLLRPDRKTGQLFRQQLPPVTWASSIDLKTGDRSVSWRPVIRNLANLFRSCPAHWAPITGSQWRSAEDQVGLHSGARSQDGVHQLPPQNSS